MTEAEKQVLKTLIFFLICLAGGLCMGIYIGFWLFGTTVPQP